MNLNTLPHSLRTGMDGEDKAVEYLIEHNYCIIARNWQFHHLEIDIIAENKDFIIFCEVKTRKSNSFGEPEIFVTKGKQNNIISAANNFIRKYKINKEARFDILSIIYNCNKAEIKHITNAFSPNW